MTAIISPCGQYRYRLERIIAMEGPVYAFFGINPSTADANLDDATVRKWIGFTKRWGASAFIVGNAFAYRATDVRELARHPMTVGQLATNHSHLVRIIADADYLVPCWGNRNKVPKSLHASIDELLELLRASGKPLLSFGLTASGDPMHPLMLGYDTPLTPFVNNP